MTHLLAAWLQDFQIDPHIALQALDCRIDQQIVLQALDCHTDQHIELVALLKNIRSDEAMLLAQ